MGAWPDFPSDPPLNKRIHAHTIIIHQLVGCNRLQLPEFKSLRAWLNRHSLELEFRTSSSNGLIFLSGDFDKAHMVSAYMRKGLLSFARRCGSGSAFEIYQERLDDNRWHKVSSLQCHDVKVNEATICHHNCDYNRPNKCSHMDVFGEVISEYKPPPNEFVLVTKA